MLVFQDKFDSPTQVIHKAMKQFEEYQKAQEIDLSNEDILATTRGRIPKVWRKPEEDGLKGN